MKALRAACEDVAGEDNKEKPADAAERVRALQVDTEVGESVQSMIRATNG